MIVEFEKEAERPATTIQTNDQDNFIQLDELRKRIPVCTRTILNWRKKGILPYVKIGSAVLYHWPTVREALLRRQSSRS